MREIESGVGDADHQPVLVAREHDADGGIGLAGGFEVDADTSNAGAAHLVDTAGPYDQNLATAGAGGASDTVSLSATGYVMAAHKIELASKVVARVAWVGVEMGVKVEKHHHEVASAQHELGMKFDTLTLMADQMQIYKYCIHQVAHIYGKTATFMPKPVYGDNGSGMHCHQSLWKDGEPLFYDETGYAGLSDMARYYIGGILKHAPSLLAFTNPTVNSYHRLVPGFEAPVNLVYSQRNRSACIRIPMYSSSPKAKSLELRSPDPSGWMSQACGAPSRFETSSRFVATSTGFALPSVATCRSASSV